MQMRHGNCLRLEVVHCPDPYSSYLPIIASKGDITPLCLCPRRKLWPTMLGFREKISVKYDELHEGQK